jgi:hypothetical protein
VSDAWALLLIVMPSDTPVPPEWPGAMASLQRMAWALDIAGPTEHWRTWQVEVDWCRRVYQQVRDLPPSTDAARWAGYSPCEELRFWREVRQRLDWSTLWRNQLDKVEALDAVDDRIEVWSAIQDLRKHSSLSQKRIALGRLRSRLGPDAYYAGRVPE